MKMARTFADRITQLGRIASLERDLMKRRGQQGVMPRTNKAKHILVQYEKNVFGYVPSAEDICLHGSFKTNWENIKYTTFQFQGKTTYETGI